MDSRKLLKSAKRAYKASSEYQFNCSELRLGPWTSYSLITDPKHLCFVLSRYKFCAKMLEGKKTIMEVGAGDGFGLPIIAQAAQKVYVVDWDKRFLDGNAKRLTHLKNITYIHNDFNESAPDVSVEGVFLIDVIEHVEPRNENTFLNNIMKCLKPDGVLIVGTPNITASKYASKQNRVPHINLKSAEMLRRLMEKRFNNVFMFGMNDEVLHTGYHPMCHYLWAVCAGLRDDKK